MRKIQVIYETQSDLLRAIPSKEIGGGGMEANLDFGWVNVIETL